MNRKRQNEELDRIALEAAAWIVRRDRGLEARETEEFDRWCRADVRHGVMLGEREREWRRFDALGLASVARDRPGRRACSMLWRLAIPVGIAAAAGLIWLTLRSPDPASSTAPELLGANPALASLVPEQRLFLADGSVVDLASGASIEVALGAGERRIRLNRGAAHFAVAREAERPFVVVTETDVEVRALGTSFDVWLEPTKVDVRVVSGRVQVKAAASGGETSRGDGISVLAGGQRVVVTTDRRQAPRIETVTPSSAATSLPGRYEFDRTPLVRVVAELNRRGDIWFFVDDAELSELPIYASFRADNVDAFVRLLEGTGEMAVEREGGIVRLRRRR